MNMRTFDITATGPKQDDVRLAQTVKAPDAALAAKAACRLLQKALVADSTTRLLIERREV